MSTEDCTSPSPQFLDIENVNPSGQACTTRLNYQRVVQVLSPLSTNQVVGSPPLPGFLAPQVLLDPLNSDDRAHVH